MVFFMFVNPLVLLTVSNYLVQGFPRYLLFFESNSLRTPRSPPIVQISRSYQVCLVGFHRHRWYDGRTLSDRAAL